MRALDAAGRFTVPPGELSIVLLDAAAMGELHARYFADPAPTDVITFPGDPKLGVAGEICICADVAADYAAQHDRDLARELTLYLLHGYLHLAGYDDRNPAERARMRRAEQQGMRVIDAANAVPSFKLSPRRMARRSTAPDRARLSRRRESQGHRHPPAPGD